jgi:hypothetical protein
VATLSVVFGMFRVLSVVDLSRVYPPGNRRKRPACMVAALALFVAVAGCGGGGATTAPLTGQTVRGTGFTFLAPQTWTTDVGATSSTARQDESTLVSVAVLPLVKPYKLSLFPRVAKELDRVASTYAANLEGKLTSQRTVDVAGRKAREYRVEHGDLVDLITFVLRGKRSFQLTCRWRSADGEPDACALLSSSFAFR